MKIDRCWRIANIIGALVDKLRAIPVNANAESRDMTDDEETEFNRLLDDLTDKLNRRNT